MGFLFSVIIPLFNVESYIADTIDSILNQTIGFKENIQIILVNDGSCDNTEQICLSYQKAFPDNITYVYQNNSGVSAARNAGMPYIKGKYTNFMDSDDLWGSDAFEKASKMFEAYGEAIDVVSCRMAYFEGKSGYPRLDYKYANGDGICDIFENPSYGQFAVNSCFCRSEAIKGLSYDTRISYGEDAKFINQLILKKEKYGLLASSIYHYRKRNAELSLTQSKVYKPTAYLDTATHYYKYLLDLSLEKYGCVIPYIQYAIINAIKYRVSSKIPDSIPSEISDPYIDLTLDLIRQIEDEVICRTNSISTETRTYLLMQKYSPDSLRSLLSISDGFLYVSGHRIGKVFSKKGFNIAKVKRFLLRTTITGTIQIPAIFEDINLHVSAPKFSRSCSLTFDESLCRISYKKDLINKVFRWEISLPSFICRNIRNLKWTAAVFGSEIELRPQFLES